MKWIGQNIYDQASRFRNTVDFSKDVTFYQPVNNADPGISLGSSNDERLEVRIFYKGTTTQEAQIISFKTFTESSTAHDGRFNFAVDEANILKIQDGGIDLFAGMGIGINGVDILTDNGSGTATLSNIDAVDATTVSTLNAALTAGDITSVVAGTNLGGGATSGAATINLADASTSAKGAASFSSDNFAASSGAITIKDGGVDLTAEVTGVLPSANMDADTARLSITQTFTGAKTFGKGITIDGNFTAANATDGAAIHVDAQDITDGATSASGTTATFKHVSIETPRLLATNSSVTTTDAATLYIKGAPLAHTNQTITNAYALWVDAGNARFDGDVDVDGTLETDALTIAGATIAAIGTTAITTLGTIGTGVWNGDVIASAYLDADTAHLTTAQTFTGSKTMGTTTKFNFRDANSYIYSPTANDLEIVATDITLDAATAIKLEQDTTITGNLVATGNSHQFTSSTSSKPLVQIRNNANDADGSSLQFYKNRGAAAVNGDSIGDILFIGENDAQETILYGQILVQALEVDDTDEAGKMRLSVAESNGTASGVTTGLLIEGSDNTTDGEVNVTIAAGAASVTTVAGNLVVTGTGINIPNVYGNIIKLLPSDFATNGDGGNTKTGIMYVDVAGTGYGMRVPNNSTELYAFVSIPEGMKATHVDIHDKSGQNLAVEVFEIQINATTMVSKGTGNANTTIDITDVNATATNLLAIEVTTTSTGDRVYGGSVTIAAQ